MIPRPDPREYLAMLLIGLTAACGGDPFWSSGDLEGSWGGPGFGLVVSADSASAVFTCAWGTLETPVRLDRRREFAADGTYVREVGPASIPNPARYEGRVFASAIGGAVIELTVTVTDTMGGGDPWVLGPLEGTQDGVPEVYYCQ